jgi:hypothetical protein
MAIKINVISVGTEALFFLTKNECACWKVHTSNSTLSGTIKYKELTNIYFCIVSRQREIKQEQLLSASNKLVRKYQTPL